MVRCFYCFCTRFGNLEMILARNFDYRTILQKTLKQSGPEQKFSLAFSQPMGLSFSSVLQPEV